MVVIRWFVFQWWQQLKLPTFEQQREKSESVAIISVEIGCHHFAFAWWQDLDFSTILLQWARNWSLAIMSSLFSPVPCCNGVPANVPQNFFPFFPQRVVERIFLLLPLSLSFNTWFLRMASNLEIIASHTSANQLLPSLPSLGMKWLCISSSSVLKQGLEFCCTIFCI